MRNRAIVIGISLTLLADTPANAQQTATAELSGGYLFASADSDTYPKGYYVDFVANVRTWLGIVAATDASYRSQTFEYLLVSRGPSGTIISERLPVTLSTTSRGLAAGVRFTRWNAGPVRVFVQALGGASRLSASADVTGSTESAASVRNAYETTHWRGLVQAGARVNLAITSQIAARAAADYRRLGSVPSGFIENDAEGRGVNRLMVSVGIVWLVTN